MADNPSNVLPFDKQRRAQAKKLREQSAPVESQREKSAPVESARDKTKRLLIARDEDLRASGLAKPSVIRKLGLTNVLDSVQVASLTGLDDVFAAYEIPYFGINGKRLDFSRWKLLGADAPFKYYQEPKTIPRLYIPPLLDWEAIAKDVSQRIILTEGEKKAACACVHKMPCLGLGGVWSWKSKKWGIELLREFDAFALTGRELEVCFDGDLYSNENVARALAALTEAMTKRGAKVFIRHLENTGGKAALDEFLVARGADAYDELPCSEADASKELAELNDDLVFIIDSTSFYSVVDNVNYRTPAALEVRYGDREMPGPNGKPVLTIRKWVKWPHRRMVKGVTYEPGQPTLYENQHNIWKPSGVEPKRGSVKLALDVIADYGDEEFRRWFLQWLAYPLVHPGAKLMQAVLLWSPEEGSGKSRIGYLMCRIYGAHNSSVISDVDLHDERTTWLRHKQFVLAEEVTNANAGKRQTSSTADRLKHLITGEVVRINEKYQAAYALPNKANFLFTSNHPDAVQINEHDRRYGVAQVMNTKDQAFWNEFERWQSSGGVGQWLHHLLHDVSLKGFNPHAPPPMTHDKELVIDAGKDADQRWCADLLANPDEMLRDAGKAAAKKDVWTVEELTMLHPAYTRLKEKDDERAIGALTRKLGLELARLGAPRSGVITVARKSKRLVAVRNVELWRKRLGGDHNRLWASNYRGDARGDEE